MKNEKKGEAKASPKKSRKDINRDGQARMNAELDALAQAAGWEHWSDFRKAVRRKEVSIPQKRCLTKRAADKRQAGEFSNKVSRATCG